MTARPPRDRPARLLVGVTGSPHAPAMLRAAKTLSRALDAEPFFVHVGRDDEPTRRRLAQVFARADAAPDSLLVREGRPDLVLREVARERDVDLIVIGALERDNVVRELIGSTARRVARTAPCSVFLAVGPVHEDAPWKNLVVSVGYDQASAELLAWMVALAKSTPRTRVHVIHEYDPHGGSIVEGVARDVAEDEDPRAAAERYLLADLLEGIDWGALPVTVECVAGRSGAELLRVAREMEADLVGLTAPDRPLGLWDRFFGHPVEAILQGLPCSLLLHRRGGA